MNSKSSDEHGDSQPVGADSLGQTLRGARESRGLSLREISDQTRISRRYLEAIEAEEFKHLPGGIFNRSFVKSFARAVGVPEERALELYARALRERGEAVDDAPTTRQASRIYTDDAPARSPLLTAALSLVILAVISLGVYAWLHYYKRTSDPAAPPPPADSGQRPATNPAGQPAPQGQPAAPAAQTPPAGGLSVSVRARGEDVWLRSKVDDGQSSDGILKVDEVKDFSAGSSLKLRYAKIKAPALEVTINGRPAVVPTETVRGTNFVEMLITKDDYERLLRQP